MSKIVPSRGSDQFNLRFPEGMRDRLKEAAEANGRSMNAEIIARLEASFDPLLRPEHLAEAREIAARIDAGLAKFEQYKEFIPVLEELVKEGKKRGLY